MKRLACCIGIFVQARRVKGWNTRSEAIGVYRRKCSSCQLSPEMGELLTQLEESGASEQI